MQVEAFVGHVAMEVSRKKLSKEKSIQICQYICVCWDRGDIYKGEYDKILGRKECVVYEK